MELASSLASIAKLFGSAELIIGWRMNVPSTMPRLKGFRHPREIIAYAVWAYHRCPDGTRGGAGRDAGCGPGGRAGALWQEAPPAPASNAYVAKKGIEDTAASGLRIVPSAVSEEAAAAGVRVARSDSEAQHLRESEPDAWVFRVGVLLVPLYDEAREIAALQTINPDFKGFMRGARKSGLYAVAGGTAGSIAEALAGAHRCRSCPHRRIGEAEPRAWLAGSPAPATSSHRATRSRHPQAGRAAGQSHERCPGCPAD
jgi:hypothetical protein